MSSAARSALILEEMLRGRDALDLAFFREFLARQKQSLDVPWMLAMARDQAYDFATGSEVAPLAAQAGRPPQLADLQRHQRREPRGRLRRADVRPGVQPRQVAQEMAADPRFWFGIVRYKVRQKLGRTVVPGGFDDRQDPPGTDFTGYTRPVSRADLVGA